MAVKALERHWSRAWGRFEVWWINYFSGFCWVLWISLSSLSWQWYFHIILWIFWIISPHTTLFGVRIRQWAQKRNVSAKLLLDTTWEKGSVSRKWEFRPHNFMVKIWVNSTENSNYIKQHSRTYRTWMLQHLNLEWIWICMIFPPSHSTPSWMFILILSCCNHIYSIEQQHSLGRRRRSEMGENFKFGKWKSENISLPSANSRSLFWKCCKITFSVLGSLFPLTEWILNSSWH